MQGALAWRGYLEVPPPRVRGHLRPLSTHWLNVGFLYFIFCMRTHASRVCVIAQMFQMFFCSWVENPMFVVCLLYRPMWLYSKTWLINQLHRSRRSIAFNRAGYESSSLCKSGRPVFVFLHFCCKRISKYSANRPIIALCMTGARWKYCHGWVWKNWGIGLAFSCQFQVIIDDLTKLTVFSNSLVS